MPGNVYGENEESLDLARIGLWFVSILLSLSTIALLCSWLFFHRYADAFVASHSSSFEGMDDPEIRNGVILGALILRTVVALTWGFSAVYLYRELRNRREQAGLILTLYAGVCLVSFSYLAFHADLPVITAVRIVQLMVSVTLLLYLFLRKIRSF